MKVSSPTNEPSGPLFRHAGEPGDACSGQRDVRQPGSDPREVQTGGCGNVLKMRFGLAPISAVPESTAPNRLRNEPLDACTERVELFSFFAAQEGTGRLKGFVLESRTQCKTPRRGACAKVTGRARAAIAFAEARPDPCPGRRRIPSPTRRYVSLEAVGDLPVPVDAEGLVGVGSRCLSLPCVVLAWRTYKTYPPLCPALRDEPSRYVGGVGEVDTWKQVPGCQVVMDR